MSEKRPSALARWRRVTAALMVAVIGLVSFSLVVHRAALASPVPAHASAPAGFADLPTVPAKPCHRMVLPGVINNCPLSGVGFSAVFTVGASIVPPTAVTVAWLLGDSPLSLQHSASGLYRPPRSRV